MTRKIRPYAPLTTLLACFAVTACDGFEPDADESAGSDESGNDEDDPSDPSAGTDDPSDPGTADDTSDSDPSDTDPTDTDPTDSDTSNPGDALGDSVFVFIHEDTNSTNTVVAYDVATDQSWVVTDLGGDTEINGVAIHPDRTSLAVSAFYQLSDADESEGIWRVPAGGGEPESIMPALPGDNGEFQSVANLVYSYDGAHIYFDHSTSYGGGALARVADSGGLPELFVDSVAGCAINVGASPSPDGSELAGIRSSCSDLANEGLVAYDAPPTGAGTVVIPDGDTYDFSLVTPRWLSDGSGLLFVVDTTFDPDGDGINDANGDTLLLVGFSTGEIFTIVPPADHQRIGSFAVSPDEGRIVMCLTTAATSDLVLADLTGETTTYRSLSSDGKSCRPAW